MGKINIINESAFLEAKQELEKGNFGVISPKDYAVPYSSITPVDGYQPPENFPNCCPFHESANRFIREYFDKFPNCCKDHQQLLSVDWFKKVDYAGAAEKVIEALLYTEHFIQQRINNENWFEDITNYISYCENSFGQLPEGFGNPVGLQQYKDWLKQCLELNKEKYPKDRIETLIRLLEPWTKPEKPRTVCDPNELLSIYRKWLNIFPFDLPYFSHLKEYFGNQLPILKGGTKRYNPYTGLTGYKLLTASELIEFLSSTTETILAEINGLALFDKGQLTNAQNIQLNLINSNRRLELKEMSQKPTDERRQYLRILKQWFRAEKLYLQEITPLLESSLKPREKKEDLLKSELLKYGFLNLPKTQSLTETQKGNLIDLMRTNKLPYVIAMFDFLGFIEHLGNEHFNSKYKIHRKISEWYNSDKDGRAVKANLNSLLPNSSENKTRYTAHLHKETVQKDYEALK